MTPEKHHESNLGRNMAHIAFYCRGFVGSHIPNLLTRAWSPKPKSPSPYWGTAPRRSI